MNIKNQIVKNLGLATLMAVSTLGTSACQKLSDAKGQEPASSPMAVPPVVSPSGGVDGSGGNAHASSPELVEKVVSVLPEFVSRISRRVEMQFRDHNRYLLSDRSDPEELTPQVQSYLTVMDKLFSDQNQHGLNVRDFIAQNKLKIVFNSPCSHRDGASEASGSPDGTVCFDKTKLARVPPGSLVHELVALMFHELAHVYGFGEVDAQNTQAVLSQIMTDQILIQTAPLEDAHIAYDEFNQALTKLNMLLDSSATDAQVCQQLGKVSVLGGMLFRSSMPMSEQRLLPELVKLVETINAYCSADKPNRAELIDGVGQLNDVFKSEFEFMNQFLLSAVAGQDVVQKDEAAVFYWSVFFENRGIKLSLVK